MTPGDGRSAGVSSELCYRKNNQDYFLKIDLFNKGQSQS